MVSQSDEQELSPSGIYTKEKFFRVAAFGSKARLLIKTYDPRVYPNNEEIHFATIDPASEVDVAIAEANAEFTIRALNDYATRADSTRLQAQPADTASAIPTNWCDPLLTGPNAVIGKPPYDCQDIERLLLAIKERIQELPPSPAPEDEVSAANYSELITILRKQAREIADAGHSGWGNTMTWAADSLEGVDRANK